MGYHTSHEFDETVWNASLFVSFANLLQRFGDEEATPKQLHAILSQDGPVDWWSIARYNEFVAIKEVSSASEWPVANDAIVCLRRIDQTVGGIVDHFCLVSDSKLRTIVDSTDGVIKPAAVYGGTGVWASYQLIPDDSEPELPVAAQADASRQYVVLKGGESAWAIAGKLHISGKELLEHNDLKPDEAYLPEGFVLHLPIAITPASRQAIVFEVLEKPAIMHVTKVGGARKQAFGNVSNWADIQYSGRIYQENENVQIVAVAKVPIEDETAAYCMDAFALGDYATTGRVAHTIGFNHSFLAKGPAEQAIPKPTPKPQVVETLANVEIPKPEPKPEPELSPNLYKSTYRLFPDGPRRYTYTRNVIVKEFDGRRNSKMRYFPDYVDLAGTFVWDDDKEYGRPVGAVEAGLWFGVPMSAVQLLPDVQEAVAADEDDEALYTVNVSDKVAAHGVLTLEEKGVVMLAKVMNSWLVIRLRKNKQKEKV